MKKSRSCPGTRIAAGLCLLVLSVGCYPSNVLEDRDRAVVVDVAELPWGPVDAALFPGAYSSTSITGEAAASLLEVRYIFHSQGAEAVGGYTGAGLIVGDDGLHYQTLDGTWQLVDGRLVLDNADSGIEIESASNHLRLSSAGGVVVLRRFELH